MEVCLEDVDTDREKLELKKKLAMISKKKHNLEEDLSQGKFATLYDPKELTLSKNVRETIAKVTEGHSNKKSLAKELEKRAKEKKWQFYQALSKNIQNYLPLDNGLLSKLAFIDPLKVDDMKTEEAFKFICKQMPNFIKHTEIEEVISDLRSLQLNLADMGEKFAEYCKLRSDHSLDEKEIPGIDLIWSPVIKNPKYQYLAKFLRAVLYTAQQQQKEAFKILEK